MLRSKSVLGALIGLLVLAAVGFVFYQLYKSYWPQRLTIAVGTDDESFAAPLAEILEGVNPPIHLTVVKTPSEDVPAVVQSGEADLGVIQLDEKSFSQLRVVVLIYPELFFLVVHRDSDIQSPADLVGKVVTTREELVESLKIILKYYDISDKVEIRTLISDDAHLAFVNGEVDAVFRWSEPNSERVKKLVQEGQGRLIPFDQFDSMRLTTPYLAEYILPRGVSQAGNPVVPSSDLKTVGSYKALVANIKVNPTMVRTVTQAIFEHQNTLVADFPLAVYMRSPMETQMVGPYIHPGAQAYYDKDKPTFFQKYESEMSVVFSAGPILASVLLALWAKIRSRQQSRARQHIQAVHNAIVRLTETQNGQSAEGIEQRLVKILAQFTKDLNDGNINADDAQTFSLIWDKAIAMARDRKKLVNLSVH
jgi:TRAP-type uncharacterized transport system substrate-binding protein